MNVQKLISMYSWKLFVYIYSLNFTVYDNSMPVYIINPFSTTRRYKHHQNKVKVKGWGRNSSYLAAFSNFFSWFCEKLQSVG